MTPVSYMKDVIEMLGEENDALRTQRDELVKALESIAEYWNRDENEKAMSDALWYIIDLAESTTNRTAASECGTRTAGCRRSAAGICPASGGCTPMTRW